MKKNNFTLAQTKVNNPDLIELVLAGVLVIWTLSSFLLLNQAATLNTPNLISWTSLTTFFVGFSSIVLIVIAIILADIRKSLSR
jgi:hypothetical protein